MLGEQFEPSSYFYNVSMPEIRSLNSGELTWVSSTGLLGSEGWTIDTRLVGGTPEKLSWSNIYAYASLSVDSPDFTPGLHVSDPKLACIPLGLFGANGSSSIGLKTATGC